MKNSLISILTLVFISITYSASNSEENYSNSSPIILYKGVVLEREFSDSKYQLLPVEAKVIINKTKKSDLNDYQVIELNTDENGAFQFTLDTAYCFPFLEIRAKGKDQIIKYDIIEEYKNINKAAPDSFFVDPSSNIEIGEISFEHGSYLIDKNKSFLFGNDCKIVEFMNANPNLRIVFEGHTDSIGVREDNIHLSILRAREALEYFWELGVSLKQMDYKGFGPDKPVAPNWMDEGRALNNRVSINFIEQ